MDELHAVHDAQRMLGRLAVTLALACVSSCKRPPDASPLGPEGRPKICSLVAGGKILQDTVVEAGCQFSIASPYTIANGATLRIGRGARIAFAKGAHLVVQDGVLRVEGTRQAPVVFTSAEAKPAAGDWAGLFFGSDKASSLVGVVVEYASGDLAKTPLAPEAKAIAGLTGAAELQAGLGVRGSFAPVSGRRPAIHVLPAAKLHLTDVVVRHGVSVGIAADGDAPFPRVENLHLEDLGGIGMDVWAGALTGVVSVSGPEPVRVRGRVLTSQTWPKVEGGLQVASLQVDAKEGEVTLLTLASGQVVRVEPKANLYFGGLGGGGLVATKAIFTSASAKPAPGDWGGLRFAVRADGTRLDGCVVEFAGGSLGAADPALAFDAPMNDFRVVRTTFRDNAGPGIGFRGAFGSTEPGCAGLDAPKNGNVSVGRPLCDHSSPSGGPVLHELGGLGAPSKDLGAHQ